MGDATTQLEAQAPAVPTLEAAQKAFTGFQYADALAQAVALHARAVACNDLALAAEAALIAAKSHANQSRNADALSWAERAASHADSTPAVDAAAIGRQAQAWTLVASECARGDHPDTAMHAVGRVLPLLAALQAPRVLSMVFTGLGFTYSALCMPERALEAGRRALAAALALGEDTARVRCTVNLIGVALDALDLSQGEPPQAEAALLDELRGHCQWLRERWLKLAAPEESSRASWVELLARVHAHAGEWAAARELLEAQMQRRWKGLPAMRRDLWIDLARAQHACGDSAAAHRSALTAASEHAQVDRPPRLNELDHLVSMEELCGNLPAALALARERQRRTHRIVLGALQARVDELSTQLGTQSLKLENAELAQLAATDALTGLPNRRALQALWLQPAAGSHGVVVMLDIDHFKAINDRHTHAVGDAVLHEVAQVMTQALRAPDRLFRYGGEEFLALLAGVDVDGALAVMERLRGRVQAHDWARVAPGLHVTLSMGLTDLPPGQTLAAAAARADALLYRAKAEGRNRVVHAAAC